MTAAPFHILSLDGGGSKGFYTLGVLREIEAILGKKLHEHFDLIYGTSTGAIIAAFIALGEDVRSIAVKYRKLVPEIMGPSRAKARRSGGSGRALRGEGGIRADLAPGILRLGSFRSPVHSPPGRIPRDPGGRRRHGKAGGDVRRAVLLEIESETVSAFQEGSAPAVCRETPGGTAETHGHPSGSQSDHGGTTGSCPCAEPMALRRGG